MIPDPRASRAVLVGLDTYTGMTSLPAASHGTRRLSKLLRDLWGLPKSHITVLDAQASADGILSAVRDAAEATRDTLVVYFAGHGLRDQEGENLYLCLAGADPNYPQVGTVAYRDLRRVLRTAGASARYRLTVLDCCYSGLAGAMSPHGQATRDELARALGEPATPGSDPSEDYGDVVLTSAPHNRQSFALPGATYPEATGELIKILENGIPGVGPELSVTLAWQRVRKRLLERGSPAPQQFAQNTVADSLCFPNRAATTAAPAEVSGEAERYSTKLPGISTKIDQTQKNSEGGSSAVLAGVPESDWRPASVGRWRPEKEPRYPGDAYFKQQRAHLYLLDKAWADLKKEFKTVRRRLQVPFHVRSPSSIATWLHQNTGDSRWMVIAESIKVLEDRKKGYAPWTAADPYAAQVPGGSSPPSYQLTMETVNTYRERADQLRADINKLIDLHTDLQE
ncbi:caspase domain-containing protein [Streptomyces longwoodensis]|uniref:caspase family protein n=1 Tax=Streptomyces longwoodensis TaxID=68231 RepID=UPI00380A9E2F